MLDLKMENIKKVVVIPYKRMEGDDYRKRNKVVNSRH